jgi:predicted TIM-barrel fold metal-dependent hydrolase
VLDFKRTRDEIEALNLREEAKAKVLRDNARKLYRLT